MESPQDHYDSIGRHLKTFSSPIPGARQPNRMTTVSGSSYVNTQKELDIPAVLNNYDSDEDDTFQGQKTVQYRGGDQKASSVVEMSAFRRNTIYGTNDQIGDECDILPRKLKEVGRSSALRAKKPPVFANRQCRRFSRLCDRQCSVAEAIQNSA